MMKILIFLLTIISGSCTPNQKDKVMKFNPLNDIEKFVILEKGTERPFTGELLHMTAPGTYVCKQCDAPLYKSDDKFESHCGWPSFDDEIPGAVKRQPDADGRRTEIVCAHCGGHLGHVFTGEGYTTKNTRHCVNSISMKFIPLSQNTLETAYFASGCFWGTEYHFMQAKGVQATTVGYMGGEIPYPTYREVCTGRTGHVETTKIEFDPTVTTYEEMIKLFFETHDFTQTNGQGPDIGSQYLSVIFYTTEAQQEIAKKYLQILAGKGYTVATSLRPAEDIPFYPAEEYHQEYYDKEGGTPYCHVWRRVF